jgi:hypothetical protein
MMRYALILKQGGGCDYTIGCGTKIHWLQSATLEDAKMEAKNLFFPPDDEEAGYYYSGLHREAGVDSATLIEVTSAQELPLREWANVHLKRQAEEKAAADTAKRQAEYQKLKKEFG